jgi:hypothetical protein
VTGAVVRHGLGAPGSKYALFSRGRTSGPGDPYLTVPPTNTGQGLIKKVVKARVAEGEARSAIDEGIGLADLIQQS